MVAKTRIAVSLAVLLGMQTGCGTMQNMRGEEVQLPQTLFTAGWPMMGESTVPRPFGGVAIDLECAQHLKWPPRVHGWFPGLLVISAASDAVLLGALAVDLPLSAVADTLTLPWTDSSGASVPGAQANEVKSEF